MADLSNYLKQQYASTLQSELSELEKAYKQGNAGLESTYKQNVASLDRTAKEIPQQYEAQRNQIAATNALEKQAFDERANAMGLNTGTSGQAQLARSSVYQRDLAGIGAAEASAMNDLLLQRTQQQAEYDASIAQRQAEYQAALAKAKADSDAALNSALYAEMVRQLNSAPAVVEVDSSDSGGGGGGYSGGGSGGGGYDNGGYSTSEVKAMQKIINSYRPADQQIAVDGKWGAETSAATGGMSAQKYHAQIQDSNIGSSTSAYWTSIPKSTSIPEYKSIPKPR